MNAPLLPALPGYDNPELIAHGTTALVFRAIQTTLNRPVAIKVITVDTGSIPVNAARELATTVALSSQPHIVSIIDTGVTQDDRPYIVMEYCEGGSYAAILRHDGPLPVADVLEVGVKIGEALHAAHQVGIVHRDVKPSNILRSRFGPALTDFGIARAPDELGSTLTREMMTPHHASPEALLHQAQSGISDVYSLASTMWTLLVGHPPFVDPLHPALDMYAFRDRVLHDDLPPMTREDVPEWLLTELRKAMAKLPSARHASALDFAEALRRSSLGLSPSPDASAPAPASAFPTPAPLASFGAAALVAPVGRAAVSVPVADPAVPVSDPAVPVSDPAVPVSHPAVPAADRSPVPDPAGRGPVRGPWTIPAPAAPTGAAAGVAGTAGVSGGAGVAGSVGSTVVPGPRHAEAGASAVAPSVPPIPTAPTAGSTGVAERATPWSAPPAGSVPGSETPVPRPGPGSPRPEVHSGDEEAANRSKGPASTTPARPPAPTGSRPAGPLPQPVPSTMDSSARSAASWTVPTADRPAGAAPRADRPGAAQPAPAAATWAAPPLAVPEQRPADPADGGWLGPPAAGDRATTTTAPGRAAPPSPARPGPLSPARERTPSPDHPGPVSPGRPGPLSPGPLSPGGQAPVSPGPALGPRSTAPYFGERAGLGPPAFDPGPTSGPPATARRLDPSAFDPPPPNRRGALLAVLVAVTVIAIAGAAVLLLVANNRHGTIATLPPTVATTDPSPTTFITADSVGGPTNVKITEQRGSTVTLTWTDPTNGTVSFVVTGKGPAGEVLEPKVVARGITTATYTSLSANKNYCFVVHAIYSADRVANAPELCTKR